MTFKSAGSLRRMIQVFDVRSFVATTSNSLIKRGICLQALFFLKLKYKGLSLILSKNKSGLFFAPPIPDRDESGGKRKRYLRVAAAGALFAALALYPPAEIRAASFDCGKARSAVEKMICADAELSWLDEEMAVVYKSTQQEEKPAISNRSAQKEWLKERNKCSDAACIKQGYEKRLQELGAPTEHQEGGPSLHVVASKKKVPAKKPLYAHCVDVDISRNCGEQSGKGYAICETYLKYLNTLDKMPTCEVVVPPGFQRPDWEEVPVMEHIDWAYQAEIIRFGVYDWFKRDTPNEAVWRKKFMAEIQAGTIVPAMRKTKVKPIRDGEEITILAYTRSKQGCWDVVQEKIDGSWWSRIGYAHYRILDNPGSPLEEISEASHQTEMLFFKGRIYFVREMSSTNYETPSISIFTFPQTLLPHPRDYKYWLQAQCDFDAINQKSPSK